MSKNLPTIKRDSALALKRAKSLISITNKILDKKSIKLVDDSWIYKLYEWANENDIGNDILPREKEKLSNLTELDLSWKNLSELPKEI